MDRYISYSEPKAVIEAKKWLGYLEHNDNHFIGLFNINVGKGGYNVFAEIVRQKCKRNLQGLPWCAVFVYAVFLNAYGKVKTKSILGRPHAESRNLARAMRRRKLWRDNTYRPNAGDIVFIANRGKRIDHCGIVAEVNDDGFTCIDGNTVDPYHRIDSYEGGAVAEREHSFKDSRIIGYGLTGGVENADI